MNQKILFIQNNLTLAEKIRAGLKLGNVEVVVSADGQEGWELIKKEKPTLVLLELALPHLDGLKIVRQMKEDSTLANIPVIVLITVDELAEVEKLLRLEDVTYFVKGEEKEVENLIIQIKQFLK